MDSFIEDFQQRINQITEEYNQISDESNVQEITGFETNILQFNEFLIKSLKNKQQKAIINTKDNAVIISDLIRIILTQKYRNIISSIFAVIQTVSYTKSAIIKNLHDTGGMALIAIQLELKGYKDFIKLTEFLKQLAETNTQYFNLSLINAILSQLTSIKKENRLQCYRIIQALLIKGTPYFYQIYQQVIQNSITPDLIEDIPDVVHILSCFYQEQMYVQKLIDDKLLFQHLSIFIHQEEIIEQQQQERQKKVNFEKPEVILQYIEEIKQKLTLLEISLSDVEKHVKVLEELLVQKNQKLKSVKEQLTIDQKLLQEAQILLNSKTNLSETDQQTNMQDYQLKQRRFIGTENSFIQLSHDIENIQNKLKIKKQEQKQYQEQKSNHEKQLEYNEQKYRTVKEGQKQNTLYSMDSINIHNSVHLNLSQQNIFRSQLAQEKSSYFDYRKSMGSKISAKLEYMKLFMVVLMKNCETMQYITESTYGLQYLFTQLSSQDFCTESFAFYDFLADVLLLSIESRNFYYEKVVKKSFSEHFDHEYNTWFSTAQQTMIQTENVSFTDDIAVNDTLRFFVADHNITSRFSKYIDIGFNGFYVNESQTIIYLCIILNKLYTLGFIDFLFLQVNNHDKLTQEIALHFMGEYETKIQFLIPHIYEEVQKTSIIAVIPYEQVTFQENNTIINYYISLIDKQQIMEKRDIIGTYLMNTTMMYQSFNSEFIPRNLVNQKLLKLRLLNQNIQKLIDGTQIFKCDYPILWNWECINDLIQQQGEVFASEDKIVKHFIQKILGFLTGSLQTGNVFYNSLGALGNIQLVSPFNELMEADEEILKFINTAQKQTCLFSLPKNNYTVRIAMICYEFIKNLIVSKNGCDILRKSKLAETLLYYQNKSVKILTKNNNYNISNLCLMSFTFSLLFTYYEESMQILIDSGVIELLRQCAYDHNLHRIQKLILHTISISTQYADDSQIMQEIKYNRRKKCAADHNCCASNNHDDDLCILINSAMSTTDPAIRYLYVFHLGVLLKKRKYLLQKYQKGCCKCLCKNCVAGKLTNFQILTPEAERHVIESLTCMIKDIQPEIGLLAIFIIEEFAENSDAILSKQILYNLKGWGIRHRLMHAVLLKNEEIIQDLSDKDVESFYNPQRMYVFQHNQEFRQFFQMSGCASKDIKDCMYDRVKAQCTETNLFDEYFENIDEFAQQNVIIPHHTSIGRTAIGITQDFSGHPILGKILYEKVSTINQLCTTLTNTQFYNRITRLISLSLSYEGGNRIISSNILQFLIDKVRDKKEQGRIAYRSAMYHIAQISLNPLVQQRIPNDIYVIFDELAVTSFCAKTKFLAYNCITIMKENPILECLFSSLGWVVYKWEAQGQIGHNCHKFLDEKKTQEQLNNPYTQFLQKPVYPCRVTSIYSYNFPNNKHNPFNLEDNLSKDITQYIDVDIQPKSDRQNYFDSKKQQLSNLELFPDLSEYRHTHRAIINMGEELGVLSLSSQQFQTLVNNYMYTQKQWPFIKDLAREELANDFTYNVEKIIQSIPNDSLQFPTFKQRENFQDADLALYDALQQIISDDQIIKQNGAKLISEIHDKQIQLSSLSKVLAMYILSFNSLNSDHRTLISQIAFPDQGVLDILDQLSQLSQNVLKEGFL